MDLTKDYEKRFVCFMDILGFKDAIKNPSHRLFRRDPGYFLEAISILREPSATNDLAEANYMVSQFSDSVAFSFLFSKYQDIHLYMMINKITKMQQYLLQIGLPSRGAITKGKLNHEEAGVIFGPALLDAVHLSENKDKRNPYPRVRLAPNLKDEFETSDILRKHKKTLIAFEEGVDYVEYIKFWGDTHTDTIDTVSLIIKDGLQHERTEVREKYLWLDKKWRDREDNSATIAGKT